MTMNAIVCNNIQHKKIPDTWFPPNHLLEESFYFHKSHIFRGNDE